MVFPHLDANKFFLHGTVLQEWLFYDSDTTQSRPFIFKSPKTFSIMTKMKFAIQRKQSQAGLNYVERKQIIQMPL